MSWHVHLLHLPKSTTCVWFNAHYNCEGNDRYDHGWAAAVGRCAVFIGKGARRG